jgi:hypothetical protein
MYAPNVAAEVAEVTLCPLGGKASKGGLEEGVIQEVVIFC